SVLRIAVVGLMLIQCGCGSEQQAKTGFLKDYSRLRKVSDSTLRYVNSAAVSRYSNFMVDSVGMHFHHGSKAIKERSKGNVTQREMNDITNYMHSKLVAAVRNSGNNIVYRAGPGVARIRVAITDITTSELISLMPTARAISKAGVGGASMEAEIVDSMTGEQVAALVESRKGSRIPLADLGKWDSTKRVIDEWAKSLQARLR
ncbi:hypothetical protein LCGC14_2645560, partial [marine sediment metagenome]